MIEIKHHLIGNRAVDTLGIEATDEPGSGDGYHEYIVWNINADPKDVYRHEDGHIVSADNAEALEHLTKAMEALQRRTRNRLARGVEGTLQA